VVFFLGEVIRMRATAQVQPAAANAFDSPLDIEERTRVLRALDALLEGDEEEQRETFDFLRKALDEDRPSYRRVFSPE
jgi:hypothetical protein